MVTWSRMVGVAEAAAERLAEQGLGLEVIDLRSLWPWDQEMVFASVRKTGRLLVVQEAVRVGGFGAEVAATVAEQLAPDLRAPVAGSARRACRSPIRARSKPPAGFPRKMSPPP